MIKKTLNFSFFLAIVLNTNAQSPTITSFSPDSGSAGTLITIVGTNLERPTAFTTGGINTLVVSDTSVLVSNYGDTLVGLIMPGSVTGVISVTTAKGTAVSISNFKVIRTPYPSLQQGNKLAGTGAMGNAGQGISVSISADGNTEIMGGYLDNNDAGAAWIYNRSNGVWSQQGNKLVGKGAVNTTFAARQGTSVAISADGNTAIVGGDQDDSAKGAAWIYTRSGGVWTQQGNKLVGTGELGSGFQGSSVSISADGNTAVVGAYLDDNQVGAVWVFTRSGGVWAQQGNKLVGTGATGNAGQGAAVSISADGNTIIVGGSADNSNIGAVWVFTRSGGAWAQQGSKLVGTGAIGEAGQGGAVSISADGNTAIVGGLIDNSDIGAAWVFNRSAGAWSQQGYKLVGTGAINVNGQNGAAQGTSVSISADGNTAIVGGAGDNSYAGATWVYTRSGGVWTQQGNKLVGTGAIHFADQGAAIAISADGNTAIVGGGADNSTEGAVWVFVSSNSVILTAVNEIIRTQNELAVYPNPSNGLFTIQSTNEGIYSIIGELGQIVQTFKLNAENNYNVNVQNLNNGIYFIVGYDGAQAIKQKVLVAK